MFRFKIIAAACVLAASSIVAQAGGFDRGSVKDGAYAAPFSWTGFYLGLDAGALWADVDGRFVSPAGGFDPSRNSTAVIGGHAGYQHQFGNIVAGVEAGYSSALSSGWGSAGPGASCDVVAPFACQAQIQNILQVGGRLGWAQQNWLLYGTGGWARAEIETRIQNTSTGATFDSDDARHNGWFAGVGFDYMVARGVSLGIEYVHYDFDAALHTVPLATDNRRVDATADAVRARLTFKVGP
jgi:outer membrane immunogenic protein